MKLYYYSHGEQVENFGDNLNSWVWRRLLSGYLDNDRSAYFIGFGTLLNGALSEMTAPSQKRVVFSTGAGYGEKPLLLDQSWTVYCVRGPLSANVLGLPQDMAVTDGAALIRRLYQPTAAKRWRYSYMPHIELIADKAWKRAARDNGFGYIDPRWPTETVLAAISQTEILVTEAMHGAIVADALRIPWIPVVASSVILEFKWLDWCASLGLEYAPVPMTRLVNPRPVRDLLTPARKVRDWAQHRAVDASLKRVTRLKPTLSDDTNLERRIVQLEHRLDRFKGDVDRGLYCVDPYRESRIFAMGLGLAS